LLERFETTWEKSKLYLTSANDIKNIVNYYKIIQTAKSKSRKFESALETFDSTIFFTIPNILVLYSAFEFDSGLFRNKYSNIVHNEKAKDVYESLISKVLGLAKDEKDKLFIKLEYILLDETDDTNKDYN
jgi:hypothetical protein